MRDASHFPKNDFAVSDGRCHKKFDRAAALFFGEQAHGDHGNEEQIQLRRRSRATGESPARSRSRGYISPRICDSMLVKTK